MKDNVNRIRTRIAPSPTGMPHVGTALQALLNFVYAKKNNGKFIVRIEDTDQKRFVEGSEEAIYDALDWLGLKEDESPRIGGPFEPYKQSERLDIYKKYAQYLVDKGHAYYCFCSKERLDKLREEQKKQHKPPMYDGHCRHLSKQEVEENLKRGKPYVIRLKVPKNETIIVNDLLRGEVKFDSNVVDDQVLLKSDGFPTYHLAVVVDDHLMKISHTVRGEEWLPSAPKHVLLYKFFGWQMPIFVHLPTLRNKDRSKLSKRKGHTSLIWYRANGYLPQALKNFLALLVWLPKNQQEVFSQDVLLKEFDFKDIKVTGPIFDTKKLDWFNGLYIRKLTLDELFSYVKNWIKWVLENDYVDNQIKEKVGVINSWLKKDEVLFKGALNLAHKRLVKLLDLFDLIDFYFKDSLVYDKDDLLQNSPKKDILNFLKQVVSLEDNFYKDSKTWELKIRSLADLNDLTHKSGFMSMRSALTSKKYTPPLWDMIKVMGLDMTRRRLNSAIEFLKNN